jgi:hypothetical protein
MILIKYSSTSLALVCVCLLRLIQTSLGACFWFYRRKVVLQQWVGAETWRSSGAVYAPEDPKVTAPTKVGVKTEVARSRRYLPSS